MRLSSIVPLLSLVAALPSVAVESVLTESEGRFNDEPSMARAADGSLYLAWNGFRDGADALMVARYQFAGGVFRKLGAWEALAGRGVYILNPKVVASAEGVVVLYAVEHQRAWDIVALTCFAGGVGRPVTVVADGAANVKPDGVWLKGTLWVTWESNRGGARRIMLASVRDGQASQPEEVSGGGQSNYGPSLAVESNGNVAVAWHSFRENNYDIFLRRRSVRGEWSAERRLTSAPTMDRHAALAIFDDELWLFYENSNFKNYQTGYSLERKVIAARVTPRGLESPRNLGEAPAYKRGEGASPAFDGSGRLWLAYLQPRLPNDGFEVWFTGFNGERWLDARAVSSEKGMDRKPALVIAGDWALLAFQFDNMIGRPASRKLAIEKSESKIMLTAIDLRGMPAAAPASMEPLQEPKDAFTAGELRVQYGEDSASPTIDYGGRKLKVLFGDLHTHSDISVCQRCTNQSVDENYQVRRDLHRLDFACMTDHGYNQVPYLWNYTAKMARANEDSGRMMTFLAQEWTSEFKKLDEKHPYGFYGHRNLILADPYFPRWWSARDGQTPAEVWAELEQMKANYVTIPHQLADTGNVPTDWSFVDETRQPVAEIFQARGSYEYSGTARQAVRSIPQPGWFIQDAWARGIVIGVIASPDHAGGMGKACVYAPELTREAILNAIRARHTYGTTAARIFLDMRVNGHLMGDEIPAAEGKPVEVKVSVQAPGEIARIEICRNNQFIYTKTPQSRSADFRFMDTAPLAGTSYYYVRVVQKDEEMAWSSPVWLGSGNE